MTNKLSTPNWEDQQHYQSVIVSVPTMYLKEKPGHSFYVFSFTILWWNKRVGVQSLRKKLRVLWGLMRKSILSDERSESSVSQTCQNVWPMVRRETPAFRHYWSPLQLYQSCNLNQHISFLSLERFSHVKQTKSWKPSNKNYVKTFSMTHRGSTPRVWSVKQKAQGRMKNLTVEYDKDQTKVTACVKIQIENAEARLKTTL